jgi:hypothetical protein
MPLLPWRTDSDGFCFVNQWTFDSAERVALSGIATPIAAQAGPLLAALVPPLFADPGTMATITTVAIAAVNTILNTATLPTYGMCGGMAYASADYWRAKMPIPRGGFFQDNPDRTTAGQAAVRNMIWGRLLDSLSGGGCMQQTILWSLALNQLPQTLGGGTGTLSSWTAKEWVKIKATIDAGDLCPIGLIYNGRNLWDQHQILVYGYDDFGTSGVLYVYDSNAPHMPGNAAHTGQFNVLTFNPSPGGLIATSPSDNHDSVAGFFATNYAAKTPPAGLATNFGQFINFEDDTRTWMQGYGAVMPVASAAELATLGGSATSVRATNDNLPTSLPRPRDNALLREHSAAPVFLYEGGCPFHVPDPTTLNLFGGFAAVQLVPDGTLTKFVGPPDNGTLLKEKSSSHVFQVNNGIATLSTTVASNASVRMVFDGALASLFLDSLTISVSRVTVGGSCTGTVHLKAAFPDGDFVVALSTNQAAYVTIPANVKVTKGNLTATFTITAKNVPLPGPTAAVAILATLGDTTVTATVAVQLPRIKSFTLSPTTVTAGQSSTGTIVIESGYAANIVVNLICATGFVSPLKPVTIGMNTTSVTFPVHTPASAISFAPAKADIQASYADVVADAILTVNPSVVAGVVKSVSLASASVAGGGTVNGTVTLIAAVSTATNVGMTSMPMVSTGVGTTSPLVASIKPSTVVVAAGATQGHFQVTTNPGGTGQARIEAIASGFALATLTVT